MFFHSRFGQNWLLVRYSSTDPGAMRRRVEAVWKDIAPDVPFEAEFSEQIVGELYETEAARAQTFAALALLAGVVACLGLFGLAAFTAQPRAAGTGLRQVRGATPPPHR